MGIPPLEDGLFANLLIFDYFRVSEFLKVGKVGKVRKVGRVYRPWEVSHLFSQYFTSNAVRIMSGPPLEPELWAYL